MALTPLLRAVVLVTGTCLLMSCGFLGPQEQRLGLRFDDPRQLPAMLDSLAAVARTNRGLTAFKGLGTLRWRKGVQVQHFRVAMAGVMPDRLRIEMLGPTGQPMVQVADDGRRLTIRTLADGRTIELPTGAGSLGDVLGIDITPREIVFLLAGRFPIQDFADVRPAADAQQDRPGLRFGAHRRDGAYVVRLDAGATVIERLEALDGAHQRRYLAHYAWAPGGDPYRFPLRLVLTGGDGPVLELDRLRFWPNPETPPGLFDLQSSDEAAPDG